jgi:transposase
MLVITISPEEQAQLQELARTTKDAKTAIRIRVILALNKGYTHKEVADILLLDEDTVTKWAKKYAKRQFFSDWLRETHKGYDGKLTHDQQIELERHVEAEPITDALTIVEFIRARYGHTYTVNGATKLLHRLGFVYKHTTLVPGKLNEAAQAQFMAEYEQLRDGLPRDEVILFGDGVHPSHNVHATKAWIKRGTDKQVPTNTGRKRLNIHGVLDLEAMRAVTHFADTLNAHTILELFDKIQENYSDKAVIHLIIDNARYYKNKAVVAYLDNSECRIKLKFLPPYSPNLNFIERLWHFLKKYVIGLKRRQTFKEFEADVHTFFDHMGDYETRLRQFIGTKMHLITLHA